MVDKQLGWLLRDGTSLGLDDVALLERFAACRDEAAFAALVERYGPMVLAASRGLTGDEHRAEDVFQAAFLALARRAGSIRRPERLGAWLHGVARRAAAKARRGEARRLRRERSAAAARGAEEAGPGPGIEPDAIAAIHEEIGRLPERYRIPIVLCDLEGEPRAEAARRLDWPLGTVNGRLSRAREILRRRLTSRGVAPAVALPPIVAVPEGLAARTVAAAVAVASQATRTAGLAEAARKLARGGSWKVAATVALGCGMVGAMMAGAQAPARRPPSPPDAPAVSALDRPAELIATLAQGRGRHGGRVLCAALSRDGRSLATSADEDKDIKLWDPETLELRGRLVGHRASVRCLAFSPDGRTLVSGSGYGDFLIWNLSAAEPKGPISLLTRGKAGINNTLRATAYSPDGKRLVVAGSGRGIELFEADGATFKSLGLLPGLEDEVRAIEWAGDVLAVLSQDGSIRLWDAKASPPQERAGVPLAPREDGRPRGAVAMALSPDGTMLAESGQGDGGMVRFWDLTGPAPRKPAGVPIRFPGGARSAIRLAFSPDGRSLYAGTEEGTIRFWALDPSGIVERADYGVNRQAVRALVIEPDGRTLFTGGDDHIIRKWSRSEVPKVPRRVADGIPGDDGLRGWFVRRILGRYWDEALPPEPEEVLGGLNAVAFSPDGATLAVAGDDRFVRLYDSAGPAMVPTAKFQVQDASVEALAFRPDGSSVVAGDEVWDLRGDSPRLRSRKIAADSYLTAFQAPEFEDGGLNAGPRSLALAPGGRLLARGGDGPSIRLYDLEGEEPRVKARLHEVPTHPNRSPRKAGRPAVVALSPDGKTLAGTVGDRTVRLWDVSGAEPRERGDLETPGWAVFALAFAPDGETLAIGTNASASLWDLAGERPTLLRTIEEQPATSLAITLDGARLVAATQAGSSAKPMQASYPAACVYEVATGRRLRAWPLSASSWGIALSPDGRRVAVAKRDGTVDVFRVDLAR